MTQPTMPAAPTHRRIPDVDLALGARIMADLLGSGLPIRRALRAFDELAPRSWKSVSHHLHASIRDGASLSASLDALGGAVPPLFVGLVRAGEKGTGLPHAMGAVASMYEASATARNTLVSALTYPAFLLIACVSSVALLAGVVLPRFAALLGDLGQELPPSAALLLSTSALLEERGLAIALTLALVIAAAWAWISRPESRRSWHELLIALPVIGDIRHAWASAAVCATTGALVRAGVTLPAALQHACAACPDAAVASRVTAARAEVTAGARPSDALGNQRALTMLATQLLRAGEEAGNVAASLDRAAQLERGRATRALQTTLKFVEPVLVIGFGALVAFIAAALLQAVYAVRPAP